MATESVTLSMEDVQRIQDRLLVGLAAFAEIDRLHDVLRGQDLIDAERGLRQEDRFSAKLRQIHAFPVQVSALDNDVGEFVTALHCLHLASSP